MCIVRSVWLNVRLALNSFNDSANNRRRVHYVPVRLSVCLSVRPLSVSLLTSISRDAISLYVLQSFNSMKLAQLENVAIANALQLEAALRHAVPIRFNFVARAKFELAQPIRCHLGAIFLLIRYVTL